MVRRNLLIAMALAALSMTSANGSPTPPATAHKTVSTASPSRKKAMHKPAHAVGHAAAHKAANGKARPSKGKKPPAKKLSAAAANKPAVPPKAVQVSVPPRPPAAQAKPAAKLAAGKALHVDKTPEKHSSRDEAAAESNGASPGSKLPPAARLSSSAASKAKAAARAKTVVPPPMRGSYRSLARQNAKSDAEGLERIEDDEDLKDRIARKMLVPVPVSSGLTVSASLAQDRRYCRPWTARFLTDLARAHAAQFHRPIEVSSAVRTVAYQKRLLKTNSNAAAAEGGIVSPHVTGATIDIAKQGATRQELGWMRRWLLPLQKAGKIDVEEEFQQACFHITVYKSYVPRKPAGKSAPQKNVSRSAAPPPGVPSHGG
jgi:hypothetical protein